MKKITALSCLIFTATLTPLPLWAQDPAGAAPHVVKSRINADADNAEFCLEFDHALPSLSPARLASAIKLEQDGKKTTPQNIEAMGTSLCLFPLDRNKSYHVEILGLANSDSKKATSYSQSFTIPNRSPSLGFVEKSGSIDGFGAYDNPLVLRAVNIKRLKTTIYRLTDISSIAHAWQDRAQISLAPSESVYLAKNKGQQIWQSDTAFDMVVQAAPNTIVEQSLSLREEMPDLAPGLYLAIADAGNGDNSKPANKGLAPLAAAWFIKSDFSLRALRDNDGIHVFASKAGTGIHLAALNKKQEQLAEAQSGADGVTLIPYPQKLADKEDLTTIIGGDGAGNIAIADNESLPVLSKPPALGNIHTHDLFAVPGDTVDLTLTPAEDTPHLPDQSIVHVMRGAQSYVGLNVPTSADNVAKLSFLAPAAQGSWTLRWQKTDGTLLVEAPLRITMNADAPHLESVSDKDFLSDDLTVPVTVTSISNSGRPVALTGGQADVVWQSCDPAAMGWKDYNFGMPVTLADAPTKIASFLTNLQGTAQFQLTLPKPPVEPGLYQAAVTMAADADAGVANAAPLVLPLHPDTNVIGIRPLAINARFSQNSIARFALIGISSDMKPREVSGISYQIYEEGRSFAWYQKDGQWKYKPEPQLRPIGGGPLTIKADGNSILEWPVTAGNYRLEIIDSNGKKLAQTAFSAGWDSLTSSALPLKITLPKILQPARQATAHVLLPEPAMLTAIVADQHIRKIIHEFRNKGDNTIDFTPAEDWQDSINVLVEAAPQNGHAPLRGIADANVAPGKAAPDITNTGLSIVTSTTPAALLLRKGGSATLNFGIENLGDTEEAASYTFIVPPGLKIESGEKGNLALGGKQSRGFSLSLSADQPGIKELRLEGVATHTPHFTRSWTIDVLPQEDALHSRETVSIAAKDVLFKTHNPSDPAAAFVSRRPLDGIAEILAFVFDAHPFTTQELALSVDALRLWSDTLAQSGFASDLLVQAHRQEWMSQLLRHQNADGGFSPLREDSSTMEDTAAALTALGPDASEQTAPAKALAIDWLKQRLSNTWYDDKERPARADAYAALAAAGAVDAASLHYFSDTSATEALPPLAEAHIAAAFKEIRDPYAAAFWIKKMLDEKGEAKSISMLNALAATDALSSDDVHAALTDMATLLQQGKAPDIQDAAGLLRAVASDIQDAGKWKITIGTETREISGVSVLHAADLANATARNADTQPLFVTSVIPASSTYTDLPPSAAVTRHVYRLNGVELSPQAKPARGETYLIELKGSLPAAHGQEQILLQDGHESFLRPIGCPLPAKLDTLSFLPWLTTRDVSATRACEFSPYSLNTVLSAGADDGKENFRVIYFAHIDAMSVGDVPPAKLRILKAQ